MADTVHHLQAELAPLVLEAFTEVEALRLGQILVDLALQSRMPVVIDIRTPDRTLFHAGLPGSAPLNDRWARRKSNTVLQFHEASLIVALRNRSLGETLDRHGLPAEEFAESGGAVPIRVRGVGVVAVATVSGLPEADDHALVVRGLKALIAG